MKNKKNGLAVCALLGLAAGAAAWYLLGTDDGKKQLDRANDGIKSLTRSLKDVSKKEAKRAQRLANQASEELHALKNKATDEFGALKNKAKELGRDVLDKTNSSAQRLAGDVDNAIDSAKNKVDNA